MKHFLLLILLVFTVSCAQTAKKAQTTAENADQYLTAPYVLLISIDGYRHDYTKKYKPKFLSQFVKQGASLESLQAVFPTKTFPNHYSIVTGMYPDNHGIVANFFYAPDLLKNYALSDRESVTNANFYKGVPLWDLAVQQGMVSATLFWPGSEAPINGYRPTYWEQYDHNMPHEKREEIILSWLDLPAKKRPHFLTLYYHDVDSAGHSFGTKSKEVQAAIKKVDASLESLVSKIQARNLPINIVIVSDHGMTDVSPKHMIYLEDLLKTDAEKKAYKNFNVVGYGPIVQFYYLGDEKDKSRDMLELKNAMNRHKHAKSFLREEVPANLNFHKNVRNGDLLAIADMGWSMGPKGHRHKPGAHGFAHGNSKDMHGIFYASGPNIKNQKNEKAVENIHIYHLIADILSLKVNHKIDGDERLSKKFLKETKNASK